MCLRTEEIHKITKENIRKISICGEWAHLQRKFSLSPFSMGVKIDGWMTCNFTSFLTVFQSYQDDVGMIMRGCVQWNSVYG